MHPEIGKFTAFGQMAYKLLTTITLLCFSVAANAETYVCVSANSDDLYTFKRECSQFNRDGYGTTYFEINGENDRWLFLSNAQLVNDDHFQFIVVAINKETMDYYVATPTSLGITDGKFRDGRCTQP